MNCLCFASVCNFVRPPSFSFLDIHIRFEEREPRWEDSESNESNHGMSGWLAWSAVSNDR
jgi:hypothetical protein